ncbi:AbrB/MazE/SpoVT family DNA-binding domain-containing protein (plasmid) [Deinococcus psychrotolerans]|uniref:AbrB/MazE/SpoVT family DNA-binding domain-containing protein n=1 Tax=Deinococcus psychrotolerans TaxID=2489213 RepID=A0A3G8YIJ2_9DEIO|nr:AbrB/MazE/SpoVT family DNA-binding domain-containing protein [Deinococcus psychrotolerans]AZI45098.1 AbrB/MazE/SpoVT family DNA-binding domain-containing protein [Deinococcus psychrotolerans]
MTSITAKITSKGQVTLPREIRERLGVHDGDRVRFELEGGAVVLYPQSDTPSFESMIGLAKQLARQDAQRVIDQLRHDPADRAALDTAPVHPRITVLTDLSVDET